MTSHVKCKKGASVMVFLIAVAGIILFIVVAAIIASRQQNRFKKEGKVAEGEIVDLKTRFFTTMSGGAGSSTRITQHTEYKVTCRYRYDERIYTASETVNKDFYDALHIGSRVSLLCLPTDPEKIRIELVLAQPSLYPPEDA
jgi:hypothetical protein